MPLKSSQFIDPTRRLLWWLVAILLLLGVANLAASTLLAPYIERWLQQRGLDAEIDYLQVSVPRLRLVARGVRIKNAQGRGVRARELMLNYSWWQLLRGNVRLQRASLDGATLDLESGLESVAGERRRLWEIGGWALGHGPRKDRDFTLRLDWVRIRDSTLCYRHRPAWPTPSCVGFDDLRLRDFLLGMQRSGDEPLDLTIGAEEIALHNLLMQERTSGATSMALVKLELSDGLYRRPGHRITADTLDVRMFGSCPPRRWAEALPALGRLVGHCGLARRLQLDGDLLFSFGKSAEVRWRAARGQGIALRDSDRRWQNWRAHRLSLADFRFIRAQKTLSWQSAGASAFYWCPPPLRNEDHHYCVRAGTLQLPEPVAFDWSGKLKVNAGPGRLQRTQLLDLAGDNPNPLTAHLALIGALEYSGATRQLKIDSLDLESAIGCIPGQLWRQPDYCLRLAGLHSAEPLRLRFASRAQKQPWGFASGPLKLGQFRLGPESRPQLQLRKLHWQHINLLGAEAPLLLQDFGLQSLSGCLPDALLPEKWRPLCAQLSNLDGRGNFAWAGGEEGYLIAGELRLQRLLLADRLNSDKGLLLQRLHVGPGYLRRDADSDNPWIDNAGPTAAPAAAAPPPPAGEITDEKGLLPEELARGRDDAVPGEGEALPSIDSPNLQLDSASLSRLQGCLPNSWARLLYKAPQQMPGCFDILNLQQHSPLKIAWQGGVDLAAGELALDRAVAKTPAGRQLLSLSELGVPSARIRYLRWDRSGDFSLPHFSLKAFSGCLPPEMSSPALDIRCADFSSVRLGENFRVRMDRRRLLANMDDTRAQRIAFTEGGERFVIDVRKLRAPRLEIDWPRENGKIGDLSVEDLSAAELHACLPHRFSLRSGLPRCVSAKALRSTAAERGTGLALGETHLKVAPVAEPLWSIDAIEVARLSLTAEALELHGLEVRQLLACGLRTLLPGNARSWGIADCITAEDLDFVGVNRIGLTPAATRLELGELRSEPVALWQEEGEYAQVGLQRLSWKKLRWNGGPTLWVTDLRIHGFRGCPAGPVEQLAGGLLAAMEAPLGEGCIRLGDLYLPGTQALSLAAPFSIGGAVQLTGLAIGRESGEPWEIARLQLDQFAYGGNEASIGSLSGLSGCLPPGALGDTRLAPCYQLGRIRLGGIERIDTAAGRVIELHGFSVEGVQLIQPDYPGGLPAQLLQLETLFSERLRFGAGEVVAQDLVVEGIASCVPRGYIERVDLCLALERLSASGRYSAGDGGLALAQLRLEKLQLLSSDGRQLVRGESVALEQLLSSRALFRFQRLEVADFAFFDRPEGAPEYHRHSVIGRLAGMEVEQLEFDRIGRRLEIANIDALRPRLILMRDRGGEYPLLKEITALTGADQTPLVRAAEAVTEKLKFRYHIHQLDVRHGTFTWVDREGQYRARLPIRAIYLTIFNVSNAPGVPPSVLLLNGRPGGFGEIQLAGTIDYLDTRKWSADLTGYIKNTSLIPATPYMAKLLGYKILQGQLDAVLNIQVRENKVDAYADMKLNKIKVRRVRESDQVPVKSSFIPLDIALTLLKDGQGNVRFGMPVSGDLYDPKFSFDFIFSHLLQRAILEALFSYFTPIGVYTLAKFAWGRFRQVDFDPITFEPGSAELSVEAQEQLREMVVTLHKRPDARPGICGVANARDWNALYPNATPGLGGSRRARESFYRHPPLMLFEEFERLAMERSRKVESYLLDAGISAHELIPCAPDYNGRDFDEPRVEFSN